MKGLLPAFVAMLVAAVVVAASLAAPDRKPPRIVVAVMQDVDGDARADRIRLTFSERVRHAADRDGAYSFTVAGYRIRSIGRARGRRLVILLVERSRPDGGATPAIRYRRTTSKPVVDRAGNQAAAQSFKKTKAHGPALPPDQPPPPPPNPALTPDADPDRDGYAAPADCQPTDPAIHPGAPDMPDAAFIDSNCDGIDGTEADAVFASPLGDDANPGTKAQPKREVQAAIAAAVLTGRYVLASAGTYGHVNAATGVGVYGAYGPETWTRDASRVTSIEGAPEGLAADGATGVVLQYLTIKGSARTGAGGSAYGIRAVNGSELTLERVTVGAGAGVAGAAGANGANGAAGANGANGGQGSCDGTGYLGGANAGGRPGSGGASTIGRPGGAGGRGGNVETFGATVGGSGGPGQGGATGGSGGASGDPGKAGGNGQDGASGVPGANGAGGTSSIVGAAAVWVGQGGGAGTAGTLGNGGGGGGGGGAQTGVFVDDGPGNGGGGGGAGGGRGAAGQAGGAGGGSFSVYLFNSTLVADSSSITAGNGGAGGRGGNGGAGGSGGNNGKGGTACTSEVGKGGDGGRGGNGGAAGGGGGGAGGPSVGVMKVGTATATLTGATVTTGQAGAGGAAGSGVSGTPPPSQAGIAAAVYPG